MKPISAQDQVPDQEVRDASVGLPSQPAPTSDTLTQNLTFPPKKNSFLLIAIIALALLILASLFAFKFLGQPITTISVTSRGNTPSKSLPQTLFPGKLVVGTDPTFEPMEFVNEEGDYVGYDIDLANRIGQELGLNVEFKNILWDDIFTALEENQIDVIIASVTITEEREHKYDFSIPYINAGQVIITKKSDNSITLPEDLIDKKIAVQRNTTNEEQAVKYGKEENVLRYDDFEAATNALLNGDADAIFADLTVAKGIISENETLKIASEPVTSDYYGVVVRQGNGQLLESVNQSLEVLRQQGVLVYLKQKWLE